MSKSICIKTNNISSISYILHELESLKLNNILYSKKNFKNYINIIIHYKGKSVSSFLSSISKILTYLVLDLHENSILKRLIALDYFYFSKAEQKTILNSCINLLNETTDSLERFEKIETCFFKYFEDNKSLNLNGFINFRLYDYIKYLDDIIDISVNKFIIDKEYLDFVNLLKGYIISAKSSTNLVHLIYKNSKSILLDNKKNLIAINDTAFNLPYVSDISFSSNDFALNTLLTLLPEKLYIHIIDNEDEFINTLKQIFEDRIYICKNCEICNLYKNISIHNNI